MPPFAAVKAFAGSCRAPRRIYPTQFHPNTLSYTTPLGDHLKNCARDAPRAPCVAFALAPRLLTLTSPSAEKTLSTMASRPVVSVFTAEGEEESVASTTTVSYTHLTLPTKA